MKAASILNKYFNTDQDPAGYVKRPAGTFASEIKALSPDEKVELATLAASEMNVEYDR